MASAITLDADQQLAAGHRQGTACVAAAAGSGKTTLLVGRAVQLVEAGETPAAILTLCFNVNAAVTLRQRLAAFPATSDASTQMASTFHAFGRGVMTRFDPDRRVLGDERRASSTVRPDADDGSLDGQTDEALRERDLGDLVWNHLRGDTREGAKWKKNRNPAKWIQAIIPNDVTSKATLARERLFDGVTPYARWFNPANREELLARLRTLALPETSDDELVGLSYFLPAYRQLKEGHLGAIRTEQKVMDFTDMLVGTASLLLAGNRVAVERLASIKHLQVDEAQDGSFVRWFFAKQHALLRPDGSTMAVGDMRQSIAGFAGATPELFQQWWDTAQAKFALPRNYRSSRLIVEAGNVVARGESWNLGGDSVAALAELGEGRVVVGAVGAFTIAKEIAGEIASGNIGESKAKPGQYDVTVLARVRTALQSIAFALRTQKIYTTIRGQPQSIWSGWSGRVLRACLYLPELTVPAVPSTDSKGVVTWRHDFAATMAAINVFGLTIDTKTYATQDLVRSWCVAGEGGVMRVNPAFVRQLAQSGDSKNYVGRAAYKVIDQATMLKDSTWQERVQWAVTLTKAKLDEEAPAAQITPSEGERGEVVDELARILECANTLAAVDAIVVADAAPAPKDVPVVELSTIHGSKGDQWGTVYVTGVAEGILPHARAKSPEALAEELRLLYVAVTRPVHTLVVDVTPGFSRFEVKLGRLASLAKRPVPASGAGAASVAVPVRATSPGRPEAPPEPVVAQQAAEGPTTDASSLYVGLTDDTDRAQRLSDEGTQPKAGSRFVPVAFSEMLQLLTPHGFVEDPSREGRARQRVLVSSLEDGSKLIVYTSIPVGQEAARELGEDSIKVTLLDPKGRPFSKRQPYAARTRNWRVTLLERLATTMESHPEVKGT